MFRLIKWGIIVETGGGMHPNSRKNLERTLETRETFQQA